jgi:RNA recognition motif-containing protein
MNKSEKISTVNLVLLDKSASPSTIDSVKSNLIFLEEEKNYENGLNDLNSLKIIHTPLKENDQRENKFPVTLSFLKIFVGGLNYLTMQDDLKCYFKTFGRVVKCVLIHNENGRSKGYAFVTFEDVGKK